MRRYRSQDFAAMVREMQKLGMSQTDIARRIGTTQGHVSLIGSGQVSEPRHSLGEKILLLYQQVNADRD